MANNRPLISFITVVFNSAQYLEATLLSIIDQTFREIEIIIIDGGSTDGTVDIIKKYETRLAYWISEPDKGLYDAMNKGLAKATGDYVCFINSGDQLYSNEIIEKAFGNLSTLPDIVYGETMIIDFQGNEIGLRRLKAPDKLTWKLFREGMLVCHQSVYVKKEIAPEYNLRYRIASDFDWVLKALRKAKSIHNTGLILSKFLDGGMNKRNIPRALIERFQIMVSNFGFFPTLFRHIVIGTRFFIYFIRHKRF